MIDVNQLLYNHQLARMNVQSARSAGDRATYADLAEYYASQIADFRRSRRLPIAG